jgi:hypothetical protein
MGQFFTKPSPPQQKTLKLLVEDDYGGRVVPADAFAKLVVEGGNETSSILAVKQRIFEVEGIPVERQRLFYETDCEGNSELANNVGVSCESHLVVLLQHPRLPDSNSQYRTVSRSSAKPSSPQRKTLQLLVENYEMSTFAEEDVPADAYTKLVIGEGVETISILVVKQLIFKVEGIPVEKQRLFCETDCRDYADFKFECAYADEIADDVVLLESCHLVLFDMTGHDPA